MDSQRPDIVLVATSMLPGVDAALLRTARGLGVPTACVLDSWVNYRERFTVPDEKTMPLGSTPDLITVMDDFTVREMVELGFPADILRVVGQPAFDAWVEQTSSPAWRQMAGEARRELGVSDEERLVVFFSQALDVDYGPPGSPRYRGYNQWMAFDALKRAVPGLDMSVRLVVKPHPREPVGAYEQPEGGARGAYRVVPSTGVGLLTAGADVVISMTSITLVQAMLAGKPIISLQPGLQVDDANVLGRMGIAPPVTDAAALPAAIHNALARGTRNVRSLLPETWTDGKATARAVAAVEQLTKG